MIERLIPNLKGEPINFKSEILINLAIFLTIVIAASTYFSYKTTTPPEDQKLPITIQVDQGTSVKDIAELAEQNNVVRSSLLLYTVMTLKSDPTKIYAGRYIFSEKMNVFEVAEKFANNEVDELMVTITIPEGVTTKQIAKIASEMLPNFDTDEFLSLTVKDEGRLFPDTYYVPETFGSTELFRILLKTFTQKVKQLEGEISVSTSTLSREDIIILASIIEREANDEASMKMVSGILQNRLELGMPLQADAAIEYELEVPLNELKPGELAEILQTLDSPYNLYKYPGLPPTPIGNPGLMAIEAALLPTESDYYYYITGNDGNFYYSKTLDEHNANVVKYLR